MTPDHCLRHIRSFYPNGFIGRRLAEKTGLSPGLSDNLFGVVEIHNTKRVRREFTMFFHTGWESCELTQDLQLENSVEQDNDYRLGSWTTVDL
jgi:hypothetical protein